MELEDIGREKFDGSLAKRQICQYFPPSINCAIRYVDLESILELQLFFGCAIHTLYICHHNTHDFIKLLSEAH